MGLIGIWGGEFDPVMIRGRTRVTDRQVAQETWKLLLPRPTVRPYRDARAHGALIDGRIRHLERRGTRVAEVSEREIGLVARLTCRERVRVVSRCTPRRPIYRDVPRVSNVSRCRETPVVCRGCWPTGISPRRLRNSLAQGLRPNAATSAHRNVQRDDHSHLVGDETISSRCGECPTDRRGRPLVGLLPGVLPWIFAVTWRPRR